MATLAELYELLFEMDIKSILHHVSSSETTAEFKLGFARFLGAHFLNFDLFVYPTQHSLGLPSLQTWNSVGNDNELTALWIDRTRFAQNLTEDCSPTLAIRLLLENGAIDEALWFSSQFSDIRSIILLHASVSLSKNSSHLSLVEYSKEHLIQSRLLTPFAKASSAREVLNLLKDASLHILPLLVILDVIFDTELLIHFMEEILSKLEALIDRTQVFLPSALPLPKPPLYVPFSDGALAADDCDNFHLKLSAGIQLVLTSGALICCTNATMWMILGDIFKNLRGLCEDDVVFMEKTIMMLDHVNCENLKIFSGYPSCVCKQFCYIRRAIEITVHYQLVDALSCQYFMLTEDQENDENQTLFRRLANILLVFQSHEKNSEFMEMLQFQSGEFEWLLKTEKNLKYYQNHKLCSKDKILSYYFATSPKESSTFLLTVLRYCMENYQDITVARSEISLSLPSFCACNKNAWKDYFLQQSTSDSLAVLRSIDKHIPRSIPWPGTPINLKLDPAELLNILNKNAGNPDLEKSTADNPQTALVTVIKENRALGALSPDKVKEVNIQDRPTPFFGQPERNNCINEDATDAVERRHQLNFDLRRISFSPTESENSRFDINRNVFHKSVADETNESAVQNEHLSLSSNETSIFLPNSTRANLSLLHLSPDEDTDSEINSLPDDKFQGVPASNTDSKKTSEPKDDESSRYCIKAAHQSIEMALVDNRETYKLTNEVRDNSTRCTDANETKDIKQTTQQKKIVSIEKAAQTDLMLTFMKSGKEHIKNEESDQMIHALSLLKQINNRVISTAEVDSRQQSVKLTQVGTGDILFSNKAVGTDLAGQSEHAVFATKTPLTTFQEDYEAEKLLPVSLKSNSGQEDNKKPPAYDREKQGAHMVSKLWTIDKPRSTEKWNFGGRWNFLHTEKMPEARQKQLLKKQSIC